MAGHVGCRDVLVVVLVVQFRGGLGCVVNLGFVLLLVGRHTYRG
jgi:hypothetical protein